MIVYSHVLSPAGPCNSDEFFEFKDAAFEAKWKGKKIPIQVTAPLVRFRRCASFCSALTEDLR